MIENEEIRTQVASTAVEQLFANVDVEAAVAERLPPAQQGSPPCWPASRARAPIARRTGTRAASRPDGLGRDDHRQRQLVRLLDDETTFIQTEGGAVVLDLRRS